MCQLPLHPPHTHGIVAQGQNRIKTPVVACYDPFVVAVEQCIVFLQFLSNLEVLDKLFDVLSFLSLKSKSCIHWDFVRFEIAPDATVSLCDPLSGIMEHILCVSHLLAYLTLWCKA